MTVAPVTLTLLKPDDWHLHLRDGALLNLTVPASAAYLGRAVVMPNLNPPVTTPGAALAYKKRILRALPANSSFLPLMTLYLTDETTPALVREAKDSGIVAFKLYPRGATTHSAGGVSSVKQLAPVFAAMERAGVKLLVHGEVNDPAVDIFDREAVFIERELIPLRAGFPGLKIVMEHLTTKIGAQFIEAGDKGLAATVTPQHLYLNRNQLLAGGIRPHYYCLPVLKREEDRAYLTAAVTGIHADKFFLGTDSAPHWQEQKESACGCAGIFSAPVALELYAEIFAAAGRLDLLENFTSRNGPEFYGLAPNRERITLTAAAKVVPDYYENNGKKIIPFAAGKKLRWTVQK